jgi:hypothetical protein
MDNQNPTPNMTPQGSASPIPQTGQASVEENKSVGALIGSVIIVIILIIGGFYLWSTKVEPVVEPAATQQGAPVMNGAPLEMTAEEQALNQPDLIANQMAAVATSDEVTSIDADLKATNLDNLDDGLQ